MGDVDENEMVILFQMEDVRNNIRDKLLGIDVLQSFYNTFTST